VLLIATSICRGKVIEMSNDCEEGRASARS
jgi:hypothetical protein